MTVAEAIRQGEACLRPVAGDDARLEARVLLAAVLGRSREWLYLHPGSSLSPAATAQFHQLLAARRAGEPLAYLLGVREFYGRSFMVDARVLVPRPETECLLEAALAFVRSTSAVRVVDVGTGSGVLGITIALECPWVRVVLLDASADALAVARENARRLGAASKVQLVQSDLLAALDGRYDLIIANLPYIPTAAMSGLPPEVRREPRIALDGGPDGLALYRRLFAEVPAHLSPTGALFAEIGSDQGTAVLALARRWLPNHHARVLPDLAGLDRIVAVTPPEWQGEQSRARQCRKMEVHASELDRPTSLCVHRA
ncbi:MAG TPA: peptide chain release factor N(5)-glutamine methyltransferase [Chloroflexota bacterium]|nr:peptide chain release factor N(5)-glutamine methyltransferase [Chloroflexota bacterium]